MATDPAAPSFSGFSEETFAFLRDLRDHNNRDWFQSKAAQARYKRDFVAPSKAFVEAAGEAIRAFEPDVYAIPSTRGSMGPINRDIRFSADKTPYHTTLRFNFFVGSDDRKTAPTYVVWLGADELMIGAGVRPFDKARLARFREAVAGPAGEALTAALSQAAASGFEPGGEGLKRVPKPYESDHPRAALLRHKTLTVGARFNPPPAACATAAFASWCAERLSVAAPVLGWLREHVG